MGNHYPAADALAQKGVGFAFLHYALDVGNKERGEYLLRWIGGYYEQHWSVNPSWKADFTALPKHPITRGVRPFAIHDEWYYHMRFADGMSGLTPLLTAIPPDKTRERLKSNLKKIGFLERAKGKPDRLLPVVPTKTSFLILLHHLFAAKAVRTVELRNLVTNPFWKYLGYKSDDALRALLREADAAGLVGKYVVADQLEQVTTCFTLDEFLERRARL